MSPRNKIKNEEVRAESMEKILDAAYKLISKNGYDNTSISQIANAAGVSKGLMYNYFDSKEELLKALIYRTFGSSEKLITKEITQDPSKALENIFNWFFSELRNNIGEWRFLSGIILKAEIYTFIKELVNVKIEEFSKQIGDLLHQMDFENPKEEALIIGCLFDGIGFQYLVAGEDYPLDELQQYLLKKYCGK